MTVFVEAQTEPFVEQRRNMAENYQDQFRTEANIRRPTVGHVLKEDSYAILRVMGVDGNFIPVIDAAGEEVSVVDGRAYTTYYSNFFVQAVTEERSEKQQIIDTFGESYIFFFGESPRFITVQGMLLNTADFNWRDEFWANYELYFRGTKLVERGARLYLIFDDIIAEGYMVRANATTTAQNPWVIPFSFQMFLTGYTALSNIGDPSVPDRSVYGDSGGSGYYDSTTNKWKSSGDADKALNAEAIGLASKDTTDIGDGRLLTDSLREGSASAGDPSTSSYVQRAANATGGADQLEFKPNPRVGKGRYVNNTVEFVQLASPIKSKGDDSSGDEWGKASKSIDSGIDSSVVPDGTGSAMSTTDPDYADVMGRNGRATDEIRNSGGSRLEGEGIRRDLGGSDLGSNQSGSSGWSPHRNTPFGMTSQPGELS